MLLAAAVTVLTTTGSAVADSPAARDEAPPVPVFGALLVVLLIPLAVVAVVVLLSALPGMLSDDDYEPGQAWRAEVEWFGGSRDALEQAGSRPAPALAADSSAASHETERGGASARW